MFLKNLKLANFRNYSELEFEFNNPITVLIGDNAQGKTSFLESIFFLATGKSPRVDEDSELIKIGENVCRVEGVVDTGTESRVGIETSLEIVMQNQEGEEGKRLFKRVKVNGIPRRVTDYVGNLYVVLFAPEDIHLVTGSPSLRRYFFDLAISQVDREYKKSLSSYCEVITRRNRVLKNIQEGISKLDELDFWSGQMLKFGQLLTQKREEFFQFINKQERKFGEFTLDFCQSKLSDERLKEYQAREIASATSLIGPHRDDFVFKQGSRELAKFGSRGEHRTAVLDLKVTQLLYIEEKTATRPILLLDDVFSELDSAHRKHVLNLTAFQQTVIASVELEPDVKGQLGTAKIMKAVEGKVIS